MLENFRASIILFVAIRIGFSLCTYVSSGAECSIRPLPWDIRLKVAVGITQGLAYLHSPEVLVIHRDLRSSNILLDKV